MKSQIFLLLSALFAFALADEMLKPLATYSISPPYIDQHLNNKNWNFGGDCYVSVNEFIRLTPAKRSQRGWLWSRLPLDHPSWMVEFVFKIHGDYSLPGDGFAFWYTKEKETDGRVFGSADEFTGLGVFFDTYMNGPHPHAFPYINAMVGDGNTNYDHAKDGKAHEIGSCVQKIRNRDSPTKARVKYVKDQYLQVSLNLNNLEWEDCFMIHNVVLPSQGYLGFSSHTGDAFDNHDIISVTASAIMDPVLPSEHLFKEHGANYVAGEKSSFWSYIFWIIIVGGLVTAIYFYSQRASSRNMKRF